jgi:indolepyruvate ferredoxin oxidoreductase alpha subunit
MKELIQDNPGKRVLLLGNEAIARGALEAGVGVASGYPGTPASEILESLTSVAEEANLYTEWSVNEKVAMEVAAAASFAGIRSLVAMKQNGMHVASDFLLHLALSGVRAGMVIVFAEDPGALSSVNEADSRLFAKMLELPLLEPYDIPRAKETIKMAFELSETYQIPILVRSMTRLSHASGVVTLGPLSRPEKRAFFRHDGFILDPDAGPMISTPVFLKRSLLQEKLSKIGSRFEEPSFSRYFGPNAPKTLLIASSVAVLYVYEAIDRLQAWDRVGLLALEATHPLPQGPLKTHLKAPTQVFAIEEGVSFLEQGIKAFVASNPELGPKRFLGRDEGTLPGVGELNVDIVAGALAAPIAKPYEPVPKEYQAKATEAVFAHAPARELAFCPGCPHRASFFAIARALSLDGRDGFVCGDIGCYTLAMLPTGFSTIKTLHSMGSGTGIGSGFGKLQGFGFGQRVLSVMGDSTFFHTGLPALINAVHNRSDLVLVILDNAGTAMTGFQPHPGLEWDAAGKEARAVDIGKVCEAIGARVVTADPFKLAQAEEALLDLMDGEGQGAKVLILRQPCALSPQRKGKGPFEVEVDRAVCLGEACGCDRFCTRVFRCPALVWDKADRRARVDEVLCAGCGVCAQVCPSGAIRTKEVAWAG